MGQQSSKPNELQRVPLNRSDTGLSSRSVRSVASQRSQKSQTSIRSSRNTKDMKSRYEGSQVDDLQDPKLSGSQLPLTPLQDGNPTSVPKSLQIVPPMDPILVHRDKDGNITAPHTPYSENFPQSGDYLGSDGSGQKRGLDVPKQDAARTPNNLSLQKELPFLSSPRVTQPTILEAGSQGAINIDDTIQMLLDAGYSGKTQRVFCLKNSEIFVICQAAREIFMEQPPLLELAPPVKVVGDVHGQYGDLLRMFGMCGFPPQSNYLFLGDYVDRGKQSLETIMLLLCYKIKYPENFFLLRGNHECASVTRIYGFYDECKRRASIKTWRTFVDTFNTLPIAAIVAQKIFCVHGGLSPSLTAISEIREIERPTDVPDYGLLNDLLWSDPTDGPNEWEDNERGVSYCYNKVAIDKFLSRFNFDLVCRAHMVVEDGYEFFNDRSLVTIFSAPNYCGEFDNWGAAMSVSEELLCSFELLKPLDSRALKEEMRREKHERRSSLAAQSL